jgi:hypothetical protein
VATPSVTSVTRHNSSPLLVSTNGRSATKRGDPVNQFLLEGEVFGVPGLVRWYTVRPADGALQWFDEKCAQDMFCSTAATKMLRGLKVKEATGLRPPNVVEPPTFRLTLESGVAVAGYPTNPEMG